MLRFSLVSSLAGLFTRSLFFTAKQNHYGESITMHHHVLAHVCKQENKTIAKQEKVAGVRVKVFNKRACAFKTKKR
jgi:hypothetical protein